MTLVDNNGQQLTVREAEEFNERFLRDNIAAFALSGFLASGMEARWEENHIAETAYRMADAMIRARSK